MKPAPATPPQPGPYTRTLLHLTPILCRRFSKKAFQFLKTRFSASSSTKPASCWAARFKVILVLNETANKLASKESGDNKFKQLFSVAYTLVRLVRNYVGGSYREVETSTIVSGLGVLLYVLSPIDLVPDFIPVVGFLDDLALISWFVGNFQGELEKFREWEDTHADEATDDVPGRQQIQRVLHQSRKPARRGRNWALLN